MTRFALWRAESLVPPVEVVEGERCHFTRPKPVRHQQQKHGVVSPAHEGAPVHGFEHAPHFLPSHGARNAGDSMDLRSPNRRARVAWHHSGTVEIAEEYTQHAAAVSQARLADASTGLGDYSPKCSRIGTRQNTLRAA